MPELLIDMGNTRIKLALFDGGMRYLGALRHGQTGQGIVPRAVGRLWLSSVLPRERTLSALRAMGLDACARTEVCVAAFQEQYLPTCYAPEQLGVDRWLAALAGYRAASGACVVVDAGTATSIDLVDARGVHLGGYILPGQAASVRAVLEHTAIEQVGDAADCGDDPPRTTRDAIHCGVLGSQLALVRQVQARLGAGTRVVLGGGGAGQMMSMLGEDCMRVQQLVLSGLACLASEGVACVG
jgi:type III pantothenate kinase